MSEVEAGESAVQRAWEGSEGVMPLLVGKCGGLPHICVQNTFLKSKFKCLGWCRPEAPHPLQEDPMCEGAVGPTYVYLMGAWLHLSQQQRPACVVNAQQTWR